MLTNLANELGHHLVEITEYHENIVGMRICCFKHFKTIINYLC